jgi:DUF1680 family protein
LRVEGVQDKQGDGYIGGLMGNSRPGAPQGFSHERGLWMARFSLNSWLKARLRPAGSISTACGRPGMSSTKLYAGLRDAYRFTGNRLRLDVEVKFRRMAEGILSNLSEAQIQRMLATEFGAMNEMMIDLYADTGDKRWLKAADFFQHRAIVDPLARHEDILPASTATRRCPNCSGHWSVTFTPANRAMASRRASCGIAVVNHHTFATAVTGGTNISASRTSLVDMIDGRTAETCNVYNMLKMTRKLFALWPDAHYADFQERALFNHILGSMDPTNGSTCYMVLVGKVRANASMRTCSRVSPVASARAWRVTRCTATDLLRIR